MNIRVFQSLLCILLLGLFVPVAHAQSIELRLQDGTRWRGAVGDQVEVRARDRNTEVTHVGEIIGAGDLWIQLRTEITGQTRTLTIFKGDIRAIKTVGSKPAQEPATPRSDDPPAPRGDAPATAPVSPRETPREATRSQEAPGVFLLPLEGMVGIELRHQEIQAIIDEADRHGPGQIIVLQLDTNGGMVTETETIADVIIDAKRRHRIVAWIHKAISAGAVTAAFCDEIYFTTQGTLGSATMVRGATGVEEALQRRWAQQFGEWMRIGGRSPYIGPAMVMQEYELSYDKDPETGRVTWYNNLSGQYILSRKGQNLTFNSSNAYHSGFADGIADTVEDLARLLDLPEWREVNDVGRRLHATWHRNVDMARVEIPRAWERYGFLGRGGGDPIEILGHQIRQLETIIRWMERVPNVAQFQFGLPERDYFDREIAELRKQLADLRRAERRR